MTIYIHIPKAKKTKLEPSKKKDTFVGYRVFHMEIDSEEQVAPPVVRRQPHLVPVQRKLEFRGSHPSGSSREEQPPRTVHWRSH
jgi:hypothetical protein